MKKFLMVLFPLLLIALLWSLQRGAALPAEDKHSVDASALRHPAAGSVLGYRDTYSTQAWLGIPYAQPPLGELRWRAPQPLAVWSGVVVSDSGLYVSNGSKLRYTPTVSPLSMVPPTARSAENVAETVTLSA